MGAKCSKPNKSRIDQLPSDISSEEIIQEITDNRVLYGKSEESIQEYLDIPIQKDNNTTSRLTEEPPFEIPDVSLTQESITAVSSGKTLDTKKQPPKSDADYQASFQEDEPVQEEYPNIFTTEQTPENIPESTECAKFQEETVPIMVQKSKDEIVQDKAIQQTDIESTDKTGKISLENKATQTFHWPLKDVHIQTEELEDPEEEALNGPMSQEMETISELEKIARLATETAAKFGGRRGSPLLGEERHTLISQLEHLRKAISITITNLVEKRENNMIKSENNKNNKDPEHHKETADFFGPTIVAYQEESDQPRNSKNDPTEPIDKSPSPPYASAGDAQVLVADKDDISHLSSRALLPESSDDVIIRAELSGTQGTDGQRASSIVRFAEEGVYENDHRPQCPTQEQTDKLPKHRSKGSVDVDAATSRDEDLVREAATGDPSGDQCGPQDQPPKKKKKRGLWRSLKKQLRKPFKSGNKK